MSRNVFDNFRIINYRLLGFIIISNSSILFALLLILFFDFILLLLACILHKNIVRYCANLRLGHKVLEYPFFSLYMSAKDLEVVKIAGLV